MGKNKLILILSFLMVLSVFVFFQLDRDKQRIIDGLDIISDNGEFNSDAEKKSDLIIVLSNQSFYQSEINLKVFIDGIELVNQNCKVENQHKSYNYYYFLQGSHEIRVKSSDGKEVIKNISLSGQKPKWLLFFYWKSETDEANLTFNELETPFLWD